MKRKIKNKKILAGLAVMILIFTTLSAFAFPQKNSNKIKVSLANVIEDTGDDEIPVIAKYKVKPQQFHKNEIEIKHRGKVKRGFKNFDLLALSIPADELDEFVKSADLESVDLDFKLQSVLNTSREAIQVDSAVSQHAVSGEGVKVAVIDSGIDKNHPALMGKVASEIDFTGEGLTDLFGHGTHVSCVIACSDPVYSGVAPGADLYVAKIVHSNGYAYASELIAALDWAIDQEVQIVNISLGARAANCGSDILSEAINSVANQGILVVVAAGNLGPSPSTVTTPGCAENALTVGASVENYDVAYFSSRGPTFDGRIKPDIVAPGVGITAAFLNNSFRSLSGTSHAAPHISGLAALMLDAVPTITQSEIKIAIKEYAKDLLLDANTQGAGLAQALAVLDAIADGKDKKDKKPKKPKKPKKDKQVL